MMVCGSTTDGRRRRKLCTLIGSGGGEISQRLAVGRFRFDGATEASRRADWVADMFCHHPLRLRSCQHQHTRGMKRLEETEI